MLLFPVFVALQVALHDRRGAHPGDERGVLPRRPAPGRGRAGHPLLDDADRLRAGASCRTRPAACCVFFSPMSPFVVRLPARSSTTGSGRTRRSGLTAIGYAVVALGARAVAARPQRRQLRGAGLMSLVVESRDLSKRFLLRHNPAAELKVQVLGLLRRVAAAARRRVLGAQVRVAQGRTTARRSASSDATGRARARSSSSSPASTGRRAAISSSRAARASAA